LRLALLLRPGCQEKQKPQKKKAGYYLVEAHGRKEKKISDKTETKRGGWGGILTKGGADISRVRAGEG